MFHYHTYMHWHRRMWPFSLCGVHMATQKRLLAVPWNILLKLIISGKLAQPITHGYKENLRGKVCMVHFGVWFQ